MAFGSSTRSVGAEDEKEEDNEEEEEDEEDEDEEDDEDFSKLRLSPPFSLLVFSGLSALF